MNLTNVRVAWRVDFNVALLSFEPLIAGARNLLDLALNSSLPGGPRALFVSSISSMRSKSPPLLLTMKRPHHFTTRLSWIDTCYRDH